MGENPERSVRLHRDLQDRQQTATMRCRRPDERGSDHVLKRFEICIAGSGLLLNIDGEHRCCALQAVRYLRAADADQAAKTAMIQLRQSSSLRERLCDSGGAPPRLKVTSTKELGALSFWNKRDRTEFHYEDEPVVEGAFSGRAEP